MENKIHKNPKVDISGRLVCAYHKSLGMYTFHKIKNNGHVSKGVSLPSVICEDFSEAVDRANERSHIRIKKTRFKTVVTSMKGLKTWDEYVELAWKNK